MTTTPMQAHAMDRIRERVKELRMKRDELSRELAIIQGRIDELQLLSREVYSENV